jgi:hypothetical protein
MILDITYYICYDVNCCEEYTKEQFFCNFNITQKVSQIRVETNLAKRWIVWIAMSMYNLTRISFFVKATLQKQIELFKGDPSSWVINFLVSIKPDTLAQILYKIVHFHPGYVFHLLITIVVHIFNFLN